VRKVMMVVRDKRCGGESFFQAVLGNAIWPFFPVVATTWSDDHDDDDDEVDEKIIYIQRIIRKKEMYRS
jgi:hypothetical protein